MLKPFHTKTEMNKPQAEENVNSRLYSRGRSSNYPGLNVYTEYTTPLYLQFLSTMGTRQRLGYERNPRSLQSVTLDVMSEWLA